jgi:hypothetical protein
MGKTVFVVSFDQPDTIDESQKKLKEVADAIRPHLEHVPGLKIYIGIAEVADDVIAVLEDDD